jgi:hypothetical protein
VCDTAHTSGKVILRGDDEALHRPTVVSRTAGVQAQVGALRHSACGYVCPEMMGYRCSKISGRCHPGRAAFPTCLKPKIDSDDITTPVKRTRCLVPGTDPILVRVLGRPPRG